MHNFVQKYYKSALKLLFIVAFLGIVYISVTYLIPFFAPFVIGILLAVINEPLIKLMEKKIKLPRKALALISLLFTIIVFGVLLTVGLVKIYNELLIFKDNVTEYVNSTSNQMNDYFNRLETYYNKLPSGISSAINSNINSLGPKVQEIITSIVTYLINTISSIPKMTVFLIVSILSAYFISSDRKKIYEFFGKQFPEKWRNNFLDVKSGTFAALFGYARALLILMFITFAEVSIGLTILGAEYALLMGFIVGLSDAIPILGTGVVMVPWIGWNVIIGDYRMALGLTIIYVLGVLMRQILEPKIIGDQIGLHPLVTLTAMYVGLEFFGIIGMFVGPVSIIILKKLQDSGAVKFWNE
ncbi:sporulation integral membrane protein YtvI [Pseudobacteroides cellulosolvens]|uniref:Sporulation integral membrane protein YtvI n=1 Tax=Pseudobacteroides cellulosolvens ATCC 35603 = DSM 2933 TaxID=398512 RepID=A0A0L6JWX0_9FIRM|nr:sporulation integral membrane protein YtvI [Pseudobacteroides cellulosolvens]KNY30219.1 sporulation integral membrane protein YtvI [Pseudobacteroides cellulosolvens ATCC 35603 = DSM 2933]